MALSYATVWRRDTQSAPSYSDELQAVWDTLPSFRILARLAAYRWTGRRGHSLQALWRAYAASFILNLPHTNALIRRLEDDEQFRLACGFDGTLPSRWTFNRFIQRLSYHRDLVEDCLNQVTNNLAALLPGFGDKVAVDSTTIRTHSNPNRKVVSDPDASWTAKNSAKAKTGGKEWHFGYKYHGVADATYGLPITGYVTTASRNDSPELPKLLTKARATFAWWKPRMVIADRGYDAANNYECIANEHSAVPVILMRSLPKKALHEGIYTDEGVPTCLGQVPMEYVRSELGKGHLYRCRQEGCPLKKHKIGVHYCADEIWETGEGNLRLFGLVRRDSQEWRDAYTLRWSIERCWKGLKESRRLERHCVRGLRQIGLHITVSVLTMQATALVHVLTEDGANLRWMVRRVA